MKVGEHVERLMRQGKKPKELIELGFSKTVITRVRRQLRKERALLRSQVPIGTSQGVSHFQTAAESPDQMAAMWQQIQSITNDQRKVDSLVKSLSEVTLLMAAAQKFGKDRQDICEYLEDGLCTVETWSSEDEIPKGIGEPVRLDSENPEWCIKPVPLYCAICVTPLEYSISCVKTRVSNDPLSGARYLVTCKSCGSKEWIAAAIKCTKCGHETYLGWWPKEE